MTNAERVLTTLDGHLRQTVELTLYGRAALQLGYASPHVEFALSRDVDAVLWMGQAQELAEHTNFWEAVERTNQELATDGLYLTHLFEENQVILRPDWRRHRVAISGQWKWLRLWRLGDLDLLLSKLMRNDPLDIADARFIIEAAKLTSPQIRAAVDAARVPDIVEVREQFQHCVRRLLE